MYNEVVKSGSMNLSERILNLASQKTFITINDIVKGFSVSRQTASKMLSRLTKQGRLIREGVTKRVRFYLPGRFAAVAHSIKRRYKNKNISEWDVATKLKEKSLFSSFSEQERSIFDYAFSEMLNNAIEHSQSEHIQIEVDRDKNLSFQVNDTGIGVFRNIMEKRGLKNELEAIQDLMKGKTTTVPKLHSGEGIFFTSKIADVFSLESFGKKLTIDNLQEDIFVRSVKPSRRGTKVFFQISADTKKSLSELFGQYTTPDSMAFDKTKIHVRLYTYGTVHISRSQARRLLSGLEKFKHIVLDFDQINEMGQAFADEVFRVFKLAHPEITIEYVNANPEVEFMIQRAIQTER
jgi:anti-sigma regulatory factor (Ser/Thr protein kinase)